MRDFVGEILKPPSLRFKLASIAAIDSNPRRGLRTYGPYDSEILGKDQILAAIIYPVSLRNEKDLLINGLTNGNGHFAGFGSLFRVPLTICKEKELSQATPEAIRRVVRLWARQSEADLVLILTSSRNEQLYSTAKAELLGNGIPNQVVTAEVLRSPRQLPWVLENIALQCYAKVGGTPWTVASSDRRQELVIGISRAQDRQRNYVVGFITLFTQDGDYQFIYSMAPKPIDWAKIEDYRKSLSDLIVEAYHEYSNRHGEPESIVLHLCKRPGRFREVEAARQAMNQIEKPIPYALIHLNDYSNFRLFDTAHRTYVPETGLKVELSKDRALLLLDGRVGDQRNRRGVPRVLEIFMDKRSTMSPKEFPRLVQQILDFARVNWRGFNAQAVPATLNYSYLVARLVVEIGADQWNHIASAGRLHDKAWFL